MLDAPKRAWAVPNSLLDFNAKPLGLTHIHECDEMFGSKGAVASTGDWHPTCARTETRGWRVFGRRCAAATVCADSPLLCVVLITVRWRPESLRLETFMRLASASGVRLREGAQPQRPLLSEIARGGNEG